MHGERKERTWGHVILMVSSMIAVRTVELSCLLMLTTGYWCLLLLTIAYCCLLLLTAGYCCLLLLTDVKCCLRLLTPAYCYLLMLTPSNSCLQHEDYDTHCFLRLLCLDEFDLTWNLTLIIPNWLNASSLRPFFNTLNLKSFKMWWNRPNRFDLVLNFADIVQKYA